MKSLLGNWRFRSARRDDSTDVVLGEDWVAPAEEQDDEIVSHRARRKTVALNRSPLARRIITYNLLALTVLAAGVLYLNPFRDGIVTQREAGLTAEAELIADLFEALPRQDLLAERVAPESAVVEAVLAGLDIGPGVQVLIFDTEGEVLATVANRAAGLSPAVSGLVAREPTPVITGFLDAMWRGLSRMLGNEPRGVGPEDFELRARIVLPRALDGETQAQSSYDSRGNLVFAVATPILRDDLVSGVVAMTADGREIDALVRGEREQVLQVFFIAVLVTIGLSMVLASTIANPLADLAAAAELGRDRHARKVSPARIRIPDLTARPDEVGRLSGALRGMVSALYDRIEGNEQFAADVAHEIKNPLASLRSAVGTLRLAKREDQREKLLDVIDHDVRRLDRLISDISNASRLDSELVKEEEQAFNLVKMLSNICDHFREEAGGKGVEFISDFPSRPITITGLEARLAQVFVNLISNAISFCEDGDAVRVWTRRRENRVLVVVEDTGPGIPDQALQKIFNRFYSERPVGQFGNHSGLGLAISKQIVEAHGGVVWAENIRPTDADLMSEPLGARFVVGLPV